MIKNVAKCEGKECRILPQFFPQISTSICGDSPKYSAISILENNIDWRYGTMVMTAEQKKAKESAEKFIIYLYNKYYPQIEAEMEKREEMQKCIPSRFLLKLGIPFFSYLRYNKEK